MIPFPIFDLNVVLVWILKTEGLLTFCYLPFSIATITNGAPGESYWLHPVIETLTLWHYQ